MTARGSKTFAVVVLVSVIALCSTAPRLHAADERVQAPLFEADILPLFQAKCAGCHNPKARKADLDLTSLAGVMQGGESGEIVVRGKPDESLLWDMVGEGYMPPEDAKNPLTKEEIARIRRWIEAGAPAKTEVAEQVTQHDVLPILYMRCTVCHGLREQQAGLDLRTKASMLKGGKSGPAIVLGKPEVSLVLKRIHAEEMPPRKLLIAAGVRPMEPPEIELLTKWIAQDAPEVEIAPDVAGTDPDPAVTEEDRKFWAFQSPQRPNVPKVKHSERVRNPIDAFVLEKLEAQEQTLSREADRLTLIRRVAFDLTGLPPKWEDVERFLADDSDEAYSRMVDHYLASPHYGERWGRYWLDVAGYADSEGKRSADAIRPHAWRYRDYVIRAFNADKPYDRFLLEQLAGDELADYEKAEFVTPEMQDNLVATGFLRMAPDGTGSDIVNTVVERMEVIGDEVHVFSSTVLGLTMKCAQCHSHKYDPIPQRDYYRLVAVFKGAYDEHDWLKPSIVPGQSKVSKPGRVLSYVTPEEREAWAAEKRKIDEQIEAVQAKLKELRNKLTEKHLTTRLEKLPRELHADLKKMLITPAKERNEVQKYLAAKFEKKLQVDDAALKKLEPEFAKKTTDTDKRVKELSAKIPPEPAVRALWDRGVPSPTYVYRRGEVTNAGTLVGPGVPSVLTDGQTPFEVKPPWPGAKQTGRRLALARWVTEPSHPLTARVMVNRIWKHHFGRGIVASVDNFGATGERPTHRELLDWLATEFVARGWSIKTMHRLMLNSSTYRQVSTLTEELEEFDAENRWLARMPLTRMDAESVRDSLLAVAGRLDTTRFGQPDPVDVRADGLVTSVGTERGWRRSIYVQQRRKEIPTILENFDLPQMIPNCIDRPNSTVASQALHLMNNGLVRNLSRAMAERVRSEVGDETYRQVERVYQIALSRSPSETEQQLGQETLTALRTEWQKHLPEADDADEIVTRALANFCHTVMNSAGFLYVD